jgi:hypothetical protein
MHRTIVFSGRIIGEITVGFSCGLFELQQILLEVHLMFLR